MTKEKLKQYNDLKIEISKLENRIDRLKKQSEIVSDVVQNGYKRLSGRNQKEELAWVRRHD